MWLWLLLSPPALADDVLLWQGFQHVWERHVLGAFRVPHRVSRFESRIVGEDGEAAFSFAQSTGVDGDYMYPVGYVARVSSDDLRVTTGTTTIRSADRIEGEHPQVLHQHERVLIVDLPAGTDQAVAVLQGLSFRSRCVDDADMPCNSDGIWPYRFRVQLDRCTVEDGTAACPLKIEVGRAWTPGRGGLRGFETKPIEPHMEIEVGVAWAVIAAPTERMLVHHHDFANALPTTREIVVDEQVLPIPGLPAGFPHAAVALDRLAFEFVPPSPRERRQERGRYIGGWSARVRVADYDPDAGVLSLGHAGGLFLPRTVKRTAVSLELGMVILQLADPDAVVDEGLGASAALCAPSDDAAPWFSAWNGCERRGLEPVTEQIVPLGRTED